MVDRSRPHGQIEAERPREQPRGSRRRFAAVIFMLATLVVAGLAMFWSGSPDAPDTGVPEIDAWVSAWNDGDLATLRQLVDPESAIMAWVGTDAARELTAHMLLGRRDTVTSCAQMEATPVGVMYACDLEMDWPLVESLGQPTAGWVIEVRVRDSFIASYLPEDVTVSDEFLRPRPDDFDPIIRYLTWVTVARADSAADVAALRMWFRGVVDDAVGSEEAGASAALDALPEFEQAIERHGAFEKVWAVYVASGTWANGIGRGQYDIAVWEDRIETLCGGAAWDLDELARLADTWVAEDEDLSAGGFTPPPDEMQRNLRVIAAGYCFESFPDGEQP